MDSMATNGTWNTLEARRIKRELLGDNQSEGYPQTQDYAAKLIATPSPVKAATVQHLSTIVDSQSAFDETQFRRAPQYQDHVQPLLKSWKSSPFPSSEKDKASVSKMWKSFAGPDDFGDTQPVDTQTFVADSDIATSRIDEGTNGIENDITGNKRDGPDGTTVIDLIGNVQEQEPEVDYDNVSDVSSEADELAIVFKVPKTPAMDGRKRNAQGDVISVDARTSATRSPGSALAMAAMFGNGGAPNMSLSQLFKATQAASSPLPNAPKSDPIFDRPSPNMNFKNSTPVAMQYTSPTRPLTGNGLTSGRMSTDPLDTYVPMNESQQERERRLCREKQMAEPLEDDEFEESMPGEFWRRQQKKMHHNALSSAVGLTAPDRVRSSGLGKPRKIARSKSAIDIATPARPRSSDWKERGVALNSDVTDVFSDVQVPLLQELSTGEYDADELAIVSKAQGNSQERTNRARVLETSPHSQSQSQRSRRHTRSPCRNQSPTKSQKQDLESPDVLMATQKTVVVVDSQTEPTELIEKHDDLALPAIQTASFTASSQVRITQTQSQYSSLKPGDRAILKQQNLEPNHTSSVARPPALSPQLQVEEGIPSSPPMLPIEVSEDDDDESLDELDDDAVDLIGAELGILQSAPVLTLSQHIAETKLDEYEGEDGQLQSSPSTNRGVQTANTTALADAVVEEESAPFATAVSHLSPSTNSHVRDSNLTADLNRTQIGKIRKFRDLTVEAATQNSLDNVDINFNILTEGDEEFHNMMSGSSPVRPNKRIKVYGRSALRSPAKKANIPNLDLSQGVVEQRTGPSPTRVDIYDALQSTPVEERVPTSTPLSTKKREQDGAIAASHARQAILATKNTLRGKPKLLIKANKISKESRVPKPSLPSSNRRRPRSLKILEVAETPSLNSNTSIRTQAVQSASSHIQRQPSKSKSVPPEILLQQVGTHGAVDVSANEELFPSRVLAMFKTNMASYTATVLGVVRGDGIRFKIRYDDNNEDIMDSAHLRKLDLRVGDRVKVEMPKMRAKTYVVVGFSNKITPETETAPNGLPPLTDIYGHLNVQLQLKGRESLSTSEAITTEIFDVPIAYIYLPRSMMSNFADRKYLENPESLDRLATPSNIPSAPSTPSSRSRRQLGTTTSLPSVIPTITESGLFANMAFAVTFSESHDKEKEATLDLVQCHGAKIIEIGFDQLFDLDPTGAPTPKKPSPRESHQATCLQSDCLGLTQEARNLGFTALIADRYCRRAKYMQALALSIPCLHYRWVNDCIAVSTVLPFQKYLLPAGESAFLFGAVRSRTLIPYDPCSEDGRLKNILSRRDLLLGGKSVLVVKGKGKTEERRKVYLFLTYALGAAEVGRVRDLAEAKAELDSRPWDWIYVDGEAEEAKKVLFGKENMKKRKKDGGIANAFIGGKEVKVVGDEFVIQSLILGALMED